MKRYYNKIIIGVLVISVLIFAFWSGGNAPENTNPASEDVIAEVTASPVPTPETTETPTSVPTPEAATSAPTAPPTAVPEKATPEPAPIERENTVISTSGLTCTLSVRCDTIANNLSRLTDGKAELVPEDGVIFPEQTVTFYEGESVFNLLSREMKKNRIHLEFVNTPVYDSAYIEGIGNLYEFDCGELSGWMYKVNGWFPNYGCSRYQLKADDRVEFVYTCDLGRDVGGDYSARNGK